MARLPLLLCALLALLPGCGAGGPNPLQSDVEFEKYVRDRYAAERNGAQLTNFVGTPLTTEGNMERRTFTAKSGTVGIAGSLAHDKSTGTVDWSLKFDYGQSTPPTPAGAGTRPDPPPETRPAP